MFKQDQAMWLGLISTGLTGFLSVVIGRLTDLIYGYVKKSLLVMLLVSLLFYFWFFLITVGIISPIKCSIHLYTVYLLKAYLINVNFQLISVPLTCKAHPPSTIF